MTYTTVGVILAAVAAIFYGAFVLYGAWIDGRRQSIRDRGQHPVTEETGAVHAKEQERQD